MTHDELRDKIDTYDGAAMVTIPVVQALRAVVELHKPDEHSPDYCQECWRDSNSAEEYPCPTIQVIEKELGLSGYTEGVVMEIPHAHNDKGSGVICDCPAPVIEIKVNNADV